MCQNLIKNSWLEIESKYDLHFPFGYYICLPFNLQISPIFPPENLSVEEMDYFSAFFWFHSHRVLKYSLFHVFSVIWHSKPSSDSGWIFCQKYVMGSIVYVHPAHHTSWFFFLSYEWILLVTTWVHYLTRDLQTSDILNLIFLPFPNWNTSIERNFSSLTIWWHRSTVFTGGYSAL